MISGGFDMGGFGSRGSGGFSSRGSFGSRGSSWRGGGDDSVEVGPDTKAFDQDVARRMLPYLKPHVGQLVVAAFLVVVTSCATIAGPLLIKIAIDDGIAKEDPRLLAFAAVLYLLSLVVMGVSSYTHGAMIAAISQRMLHSLRVRVVEHLQKLSFRYLDNNEIGVIIARVTSDVNALNNAFSQGTMTLVADFLVLVLILGAMLLLDPALSLVTFVVLPIMYLITRVFSGQARQRYREVRHRVGMVYANLQENISGVRVAQSFTREDLNYRQFQGTNRENLDASMRAARVMAAFPPAVELVTALAIGIVIVYGGYRVINEAISIGVLVAFLSYVQQFFMPIREMSQWYTNLQQAMAGGERIFQLLDTDPEIVDKPDASALPVVNGHVRFEGVTFGYDPEQPVLLDINLEAKPGETIALVGPTGAGKTSIVNLLMRFYDVQEGRITIDGHDLRDVQIRSLRSQVGMVLQDSFLFSGTILENIRYGKPDASMEEVEAAAQAVGIEGFIRRLPDGYNTAVMERGGRLSVGQRQLICFARALLIDPHILILDEATSSVDAHTEMLIQRALATLLEGRTAFVIAHRLSTIKNADNILVLRDGKIVERGAHDALLAAQGFYAELYTTGVSAGMEGEEAAAKPSAVPST
ncbi:MAG: ABC transporter ATP-binding protein [Chloroflexi bacterium]|nr:ABC transporter ATP-binding protein [Chloroflexota bacterium]